MNKIEDYQLEIKNQFDVLIKQNKKMITQYDEIMKQNNNILNQLGLLTSRKEPSQSNTLKRSSTDQFQSITSKKLKLDL